MSYSSGEVHSRKIAMTPDKSVVWDAFELTDGIFYRSPDATISPELAHTLTTGERLDRRSPLGRSTNGGTAYAAPGVYADSHAIREKVPDTWLQARGLASIRATVMLERGLSLLDQSAGAWRFRGVEAYGVYVPKNNTDNTPERWLLERVHPVLRNHETERLCPENKRGKRLGALPSLPDSGARQSLYDQAIIAAHGNAEVLGHYVFFDDVPENMLVESLPEQYLGTVMLQGSVVKIDIEAQQGLNF